MVSFWGGILLFVYFMINLHRPTSKGLTMFIKDKSELKLKFRALFEQAEKLIDAGAIDVEVKKHVHKRSNEQNRYYWLICSEVAKFLDEAGLTYGELDYSQDIIHLINKKKTGIKTTTKLSIGDFCNYMTKIILYWQEKTSFEWMPSELPAIYLAQRGYTEGTNTLDTLFCTIRGIL